MEKLSEGMKQYANNLDALREFVEVLAPVLQERSFLEKEQGRAKADQLLIMLNQLKVQPQANSKIDLELMETIYDESKSFHQNLATIEKAKYHHKLLYRVSLITLVSTAEWFVSELLHAFFELHPEALDIDKKSLSFKELTELDSVDGARAYLLDKVIEDVLRGSIEDWIKFLKERLKLSTNYIDQEVRDQLVETSQRRNLLIHNGGRINSLYQTRVAEHLRWKGPSDTVEVPEDYLSERIGTFERAFILIGAELWKKQEPSDEERYDVLFEITWRHLQAERWEIARSLTKFGMNDKQLSESNQLTQRFNYWQCQKWLGCFDEVESEVREADLSAKEPWFRLGRFALLDNDTAFVNLAKTMIEKNDLTTEELQSWPIFRAMRKKADFKEAFPNLENSGVEGASEQE